MHLQFISEHYDDLPELVVFTQAKPTQHNPLFWDTLKCLNSRTNYTSLNWNYQTRGTTYWRKFALQGVVEQGHHVPKRSGPGDLVGEYEVLSGHPLPADCVGGPSGGVIGFLSLDLSEIREAIRREQEDELAEEGGWGGSKGGELLIDLPGQHVLERTSVQIVGDAGPALDRAFNIIEDTYGVLDRDDPKL